MVPGIRVISSAESRKYYKPTQHTKPAKLRHYLPGALQQFVPAGAAVYDQQHRRRASDGGRAMYVHSKYSNSTCSSRIYTYFSNYMMYINSGTAVYNRQERWWASEGGRATEGERYVCTQQYTSTCSIVFTFFGYMGYIYNNINISAV